MKLTDVFDIMPQHHLMENFTTRQTNETEKLAAMLLLLQQANPLTYDSSISGPFFGWRGWTLEAAAGVSVEVSTLKAGAGIGLEPLHNSLTEMNLGSGADM